MTNEKAISIIKNAFSWYEDNARESEEEDWSGQHEALRMAIKALEAQPSEDCISREEAINEADNLSLETSYDNEKVEQMLRDLPSVTPNNEDISEAYIKGYDYGVKDWFKSKTQPSEDCISREAVDKLSRDLVHVTRDKADFLCNFWEGLNALPSVKPKYTDEEINKAQAVEQAYVDKMVELAVEESRREWLNSFDTNSATKCFEAVNLLKQRLEGEE